MARSKAPPERVPADLSADQMKKAIVKIRRRIDDLNAFDPKSMAVEHAPSTEPLLTKIQDTLVDVFGPNTLEEERYSIHGLYGGSLSVSFDGYRDWQETIDGYEKGKSDAIALLEGAVEMLEEKLEDLGPDVAGGVPRSIQDVGLDPAIEAASGGRYADGYYADSISSACKALNNRIQQLSGVYDKQDYDLVSHVFSPKKPILAFNDLADESDVNEQQGMMFLYQGVFKAFRNPRAHKLIDDDQKTAYGTIITINFLAFMLEKTRKVG